MENKEITKLEKFDIAITKEWAKLNDVYDYLSVSGKARCEAFKSVIWLTSFYEDLSDLYESEDFNSLFTIGGKDPMFYRTLDMLKSTIKRWIQKD